MNAKIEISRDAIAAFCQRNRIRRVAFFLPPRIDRLEAIVEEGA